MESLVPREFGGDAVEVPGARSLLTELSEADAPWAIVTSGTRPLLHGWLSRLNLVEPQRCVVADDVAIGKPDPACYQLGKTKLGLGEQAKVLVVEDAPAGIRAGKAAGCQVVAVTTTHTVAQVIEAGADWVIENLQSLRMIDWSPGVGIQLEIFGRWKP